MLDDVADERPRDPELHIGVEMGVVAAVDLGDQRREPLLEDQEVQMGGAERMAVLRHQQSSDDGVGGDRIPSHPDRPEPEPSGGVGDERAAEVHRGLLRILVLVQPVGEECQTSTSAPTTGAPFGSTTLASTNSAGPWVGGRTTVSPFAVRASASARTAPAATGGSPWRVVTVVEQADQRGHAERPGHQHRFVVPVGARLPDLVDDLGGDAELFLGESHVPHEGVEMLISERMISRSRGSLGAVHHRQRRLRDVPLISDDHPLISSSARLCRISDSDSGRAVTTVDFRFSEVPSTSETRGRLLPRVVRKGGR